MPSTPKPPSKPKRPRGTVKPSITFTEALAERICERLADGESLQRICADADMPHRTQVFRWLASNEVFLGMYRAAREAQAENIVDQILSIADDKSEDPQSRRVRIDTRKWYVGKMHPRMYGERVTVAGDAANPIRLQFERIERVIVDPAAPAIEK